MKLMFAVKSDIVIAPPTATFHSHSAAFIAKYAAVRAVDESSSMFITVHNVMRDGTASVINT
jgi:hypothetical protein